MRHISILFFRIFFCSAFNSTPFFSALKVMKEGFAFQILRNEINAIGGSYPWPPSPKDLSAETYKLPKLTEHFFKNILKGSFTAKNSPSVS